jgi:flagella basal body P-ring formation protein FlgA
MCLAVPSLRVVLGSEGLVLRLKKESAVRSDMVYLGDVAELHGPDPAQLEKLARIPLGPAPEFGSVRILNRHQIVVLIQSAAGPISDICFSGAAAVEIRLQGRQIDSGEIAPLVKSRLIQTTPWKESEIEIRSIGNLKGIELPPGESGLRLSSEASVAGRTTFLAPIEVVRSGKILRCFWITADIGIRARILTAARKIPPGKTVASDDVVEVLAEIADLRASYARKPEDILGKVSLRRFSPGDPIIREALADPFLVKQGETVRLRLEKNGIMLTSLARAEQAGRLGQVIKVRSLDFPAELKTQVTGRAQVMLPQQEGQ